MDCPTDIPVPEQISTAPPQLEEVVSSISKAKKNEASGPDEINLTMLREIPSLQQELLEISFKLWTKKTIQKEITCGTTIVLHKKGLIENVKNYRPITLLNQPLKCIIQIINQRLKSLVKQTVLFDQMCFCRK